MGEKPENLNGRERANERERFSNFVVDLRPLALKARRAAKETWGKRGKTGQNWSEKINAGWRGLETAFKKIQPNLAAKPGRLWRTKSRRPAIFLALRRFFSRLKPRSRRQSYWQKIIAREKKIFSARPQARRPRCGDLEKRLARSERRVYWYRSLLSFVIVLLIIILPLKLLSSAKIFHLKAWEERILSHAHLALNNLLAATDSATRLDLQAAGSEFQAAGANFLAAQSSLNDINSALFTFASLARDPEIKMAAESKKIMAAGALAASLGSNLVKATDSLFNDSQEKLAAKLENFLASGHLAAANAKDLKTELDKINLDNLPLAYREQFKTLNQEAGLLATGLANFIAGVDKLQEVLGLSRDKRYLLVFQNNSELRASGGFLGSYALMDVSQGEISNLEVPGGGSYDTEAGLKVLVAAPEPLWLVNPLWHFWDANWWPDWPTTAKNLMWFYSKSGGPSVDGVISLTPTVVERLLKITGPIDLSREYGLTIDADNFWPSVETIVEANNLAKTNPEVLAGFAATTVPVVSSLPLEQDLDNNSDNKPKKIIGDLTAKILEILPQKLTPDNLVNLISAFSDSLAEKQLLFYFNDSYLETEVASRNWGGEIKAAPADYLLVVNTNIAGQKSDQKMKEEIEQESRVASDGGIIDTVKITRTHTGLKNEALTGARNVDWLRIYVPLGSELIASSGWIKPDPKYLTERPDPTWLQDPLLAAENAAALEPETGTKIYAENGKTVFANWLMVDPGESATVTLTYRLPFNFLAAAPDESWLKKINDWLNPNSAELIPYSLLVQKQPGVSADDFSSRLILPDNLNVFWRSKETPADDKGWQVAVPLDSDQYWAILAQIKR